MCTQGWAIFTAFIYPGGYAQIVNKCVQIFFANKYDHATSVPFALNEEEQRVRVLGRERLRGFGVVAWGIGTRAGT